MYICITGGLPAIPRDAPQRRAVALFFSEMYQSAAEPLLDHAWDPGWLDAPRPDQAVAVLDPPLEDGGPLALSSVLLSTANLPVRYLPPGRPRDLYWQYLAWHDHLQEGFGGEEGDDPDAGDTLSGCPRTAASWPTCWRTWSDNWKDVIKFRKSSQHTRCNVCHDFEQALHRSRGNLPEKVALARRLREHLRDQYLDRTIYWNMRWLSRNRCSEGVVTTTFNNQSIICRRAKPCHIRKHDVSSGDGRISANPKSAVGVKPSQLSTTFTKRNGIS